MVEAFSERLFGKGILTSTTCRNENQLSFINPSNVLTRGAKWTKPAGTSSPARFFTVGDKEPLLPKNLGGNFEFSKILWEDRGMAKYGNVGFCTKCGHPARMTIETQEGDPHQTYRGSWLEPSQQYMTLECQCGPQPFYGSIDYTNTTIKTKETTKVAKQFDTTEVKNTALNTIVSKVEALQRALFDKAEAIRKVEATHSQKIADASIALDRVLAEAYQSGITEDDFDLYLTDHTAELSERLNEARNLMSLANVLEGV